MTHLIAVSHDCEGHVSVTAHEGPEVAEVNLTITEANRLVATLQTEISRAESELAAFPGDTDVDVYCTTCGSCGEEGCCPPPKCHVVRCLYGDVPTRQWKEAEEERSRWFDCLLALGVYNPHELTVDMAKRAGSILVAYSLKDLSFIVSDVVGSVGLPRHRGEA